MMNDFVVIKYTVDESDAERRKREKRRDTRGEGEHNTAQDAWTHGRMDAWTHGRMSAWMQHKTARGDS